MNEIFARFDKKTALVGGSALILLFALGVYLFSGKKSEPALEKVETTPLDTEVGRELLSTLALLKSTKLDTGVFTDPVFESLRDFGVEIAAQPLGRRNPFAPFAGSASNAARSAGAAKGLPGGSAERVRAAPAGARKSPAVSPAREVPQNGFGFSP